MQFILTHSNTDFDALASMTAARFLYPGAVAVLPRQIRPNVREFLSIHGAMFRLHSPAEVDFSEAASLVIVDANSWSRLENMPGLPPVENLDIHRWDHHVNGGNIQASFEQVDDTGAGVTLLLEEMKRRDCAFAPMHATLFLLGLYEDTGNLEFPSSKARDAYAAAYLLENGADLNVASAFMAHSFDTMHTDVFTRLLETSETVNHGGFRISVGRMEVESSLSMLSSVVAKSKEIMGVDAAFGVFALDAKKCLVIGRGGFHGFDVGAVMRTMGGGGHPGAGSAMVKESNLEGLFSRVKETIQNLEHRNVDVSQIMSQPKWCIPPTETMGNVRKFLEQNHTSAALVCDGPRLLGMVTLEQCVKMKKDSQKRAPAKGAVMKIPALLAPGDEARDAIRLMKRADVPLLPVVADDKLVGVVTQADVMLHLYDL